MTTVTTLKARKGVRPLVVYECDCGCGETARGYVPDYWWRVSVKVHDPRHFTGAACVARYAMECVAGAATQEGE